MASHTRSVLSASRMVLPGRISAAMAAEWVMPEQPMVSTSASSITPSFTLSVSLHAPLLRSAPAYAVGKTFDILDFLCLDPLPFLREWVRGPCSNLPDTPLATQIIFSTSFEYCILCSSVLNCFPKAIVTQIGIIINILPK